MLIAVTLAVIYAHYSQWFETTIPSTSAPGSKSLQLSTTASRTSFQHSEERNTTGFTSILANDEKAIIEKSTEPRLSGIDESVVGHAFQISASVRAACKSDAIECPLVMASVAKMAEEPRDVDWAAKMEEKIQAAVDMPGPGKYAIRNLECRTSICILEVEVHVPGAFNGRYEDVIFSSLKPNAMTISVLEYDQSGIPFHVELMDFQRR
jgi:hypothetical protein